MLSDTKGGVLSDEEAQRVDNVGVDVKAAELEFEELQREFTHGAQDHQKHGNVDEKGVESESTLDGSEEFDLEEFLRGTAEESWGRPKDKKKRIGSTFAP